MKLESTLLLAFVLGAFADSIARAESPRSPLQGHPVCEASAVLAFPLGASGAATVLVGDNETKKALFAYERDASGLLEKRESWRRDIANDEVEDIEALADLGGDVVVVGSHSRKKSCARDAERLRIARLRPVESGELRVVTMVKLDDGGKWGEKLRNCETDLIRLTAEEDRGARALRDRACSAIRAAEEAAGDQKQSSPAAQAKCAHTFNIEGAIAVPPSGDGQRLWVGLRAPLLDERAILLRVADLEGADGVAFDGIATIDLGGLGIRELTTSGSWIYGIGGPMEDGGTSVLWRVASSSLESGAQIASAQLVAKELPGASEGLLIDAKEGRALVIVDGTKVDDRDACADDAQQMLVGIPDSD